LANSFLNHAQLPWRIGDRLLLMQGNHIIKDWLAQEKRYELIGVHGGVSEDFSKGKHGAVVKPDPNKQRITVRLDASELLVNFGLGISHVQPHGVW
jgi:hypothetical protein